MDGRNKIGDFNRNDDRNSFKERRRQADWVVNAAAVLSLIAWLVSFAVLLVIEMAAPERRDLFVNIWDGTVRTTWEAGLLPIAFGLLVLSVVMCFVAFIFNMMRMRRKTDKYRKSILILGGINIVGLILFIFNFGSYLF